MIDTIHLFSKLDFEDKFLRDHIFYNLTEVPTLVESKFTGESYFLGKIHNLKVKLSDRSIAIEGSLCKYHLNNNIETLEYRDFLDAIESLEELVGMDLSKALVRRVDLATNLIMNQSPCSYYPFLMKGGYLKRREDDNGLYYRNTNRTILIYDKVIEQKRFKKDTEDLFEGEKNVLRYEVRLNRNMEISRRLKVHKATLGDVRDNYRELIDIWAASFDLIPKDVNFEIPEDRFLTGGTKNLINYLAIHGLRHISYNRVMNMIHEANAQKLFKYANQSTNLKQSVKRLVESRAVNKTPEMILELQTAINKAARCTLKSTLGY